MLSYFARRMTVASPPPGPALAVVPVLETPLATLTDAAVRGERDDLSSLLAQIFSGSLLRAGTGCFDVAFDTHAC